MQNLLYFPREMYDAHRWGLWVKGTKVDRNGRKGISKKPWQTPAFPRSTSASSPASWLSRQEASTIYRRNPSAFGGPAFFTGDGWCLLDLDHIGQFIDDYKAGCENLISDVLRCLHGTYCEVSTSGEGLHFVFRVDQSVTEFGQYIKEDSPATKGESVELYHKNRMIALTGNSFNNSSKIVTINQSEWRQLFKLVYDKTMVSKPRVVAAPVRFNHRRRPSQETLPVIDNILRSSGGDRFNGWLKGSFYNSSAEARAHGVFDFDHSSEDLACCNVLAYWTHCDPQMMDTIFRQTGLYRDKWDEYHGPQTYGDMTISKAIDR